MNAANEHSAEESDLESLVRSLSRDDLEQETRSLLAQKSAYLSELMAYVNGIAKQVAMLSNPGEELTACLRDALNTIMDESRKLLRQYDGVIEAAAELPDSLIENGTTNPAVG